MHAVVNRISFIYISLWVLISKLFGIDLEIGNRLMNSLLNRLGFQAFAVGLGSLIVCSILEVWNACSAVKAAFSPSTEVVFYSSTGPLPTSIHHAPHKASLSSRYVHGNIARKRIHGSMILLQTIVPGTLIIVLAVLEVVSYATALLNVFVLIFIQVLLQIPYLPHQMDNKEDAKYGIFNPGFNQACVQILPMILLEGLDVLTDANHGIEEFHKEDVEEVKYENLENEKKISRGKLLNNFAAVWSISKEEVAVILLKDQILALRESNLRVLFSLRRYIKSCFGMRINFVYVGYSISSWIPISASIINKIVLNAEEGFLAAASDQLAWYVSVLGLAALLNNVFTAYCRVLIPTEQKLSISNQY